MYILNSSLSRRNLIKACLIATSITAIAPSLEIMEKIDTKLLVEAQATPQRKIGEYKVTYTLCDACNQGPGCGLKFYIKDGVATYIAPREDHPYIPCLKGLSYLQQLYHPERLLYPMKRTTPKSSEDPGWVRITWDEALNIIAEKLKEIANKYGPEAVLFYAGDPKENRPMLQRLSIAFNSPNYGTESSTCFQGVNMGGLLTVGFGGTGSPPDGSTKTVILWSTNPAWSSPYGSTFKTFLSAKQKGVKFVVIDPRITPTTKLADIHLRPLPGTDLALALAMAYVIINENLYDKEFVEMWTYGFEEFKKYLMGEMDGEPKTPEWAEKKTSVPAEKIIEAARLIATNKPTTWMGSASGDAHNHQTVSTTRAKWILMTLIGMIDVPGGIRVSTYPIPIPSPGTGGMWFSFNSRMLPGGDLYEKRADVKMNFFPAWRRLVDQIQMVRFPEYVEAGLIKAAVLVGANSRIHPQPSLFQNALKKLEFAVAIDYFIRPWTHNYVDIVLPAAMGPERIAPPLVIGRTVYLREIAVPPRGEVREDWQILMDIGVKLGLGEKLFNGNLTAAINEYMSKAGITVEQLRAQPGYKITIPAPGPEEYKKYETGKLRPDGKPGFNTPTGKVEIYSTILKELNLDPLPIYRDPIYRTLPEANGFPLILLGGPRVPMYTHSKQREIPWLRELMPRPVVRINPHDAETRGIRDGDEVVVVSPWGKINAVAEVTVIVPKGVVDMFHGWYGSDVNDITPRVFDPISGFPAYKQVPVDVRKDS